MMQSEGLPGDTSPGDTGANPTDFQGGDRILPTLLGLSSINYVSRMFFLS